MGEGARKPGRPAQLSREQIVAAAASFENIDALTMRELAARLNVRHGALYRWVSNRDELFDLISEVLVDRILATAMPEDADPHVRLEQFARAVRDHFRSLPGYASHLSRPHAHNHRSVDRLHDALVSMVADAGATPGAAEQSWYVFITSMIGWLALEEQPLTIGHEVPDFEAFLAVLLRGLPATVRRNPAG